MFFMMGITPGEKQLNYDQMIICNQCGSYGRYQVWMTWTCLSLFFIPVFKWNKHFYVRTTCCNTTYELDPEIGRQIAREENVEIVPEHLTRIGGGRYIQSNRRTCQYCGYSTEEDFRYCPKCGREL